MFRWLDFDQVNERMTGSTVVDGRNLLDQISSSVVGSPTVGIGR